MKTLFILLFLPNFFFCQTREDILIANRENIGKRLMDLEEQIYWEAVDSNWTKKRELWINRCKNEVYIENQENITVAILELENSIKPVAFFQPNWSLRKEAWKNEVLSCVSENDLKLMALVKEMEENLLWDAVSPKWVDFRVLWLMLCDFVIDPDDVIKSE